MEDFAAHRMAELILNDREVARSVLEGIVQASPAGLAAAADDGVVDAFREVRFAGGAPAKLGRSLLE